MSLTLCYCIVLLAEPVIGNYYSCIFLYILVYSCILLYILVYSCILGELSDATINSLLILINKTFESNQKPVHKELNIEEDDPNEDMVINETVI